MRLKIRQMIKLMTVGFIGLALLSCSKGDNEPGYEKPMGFSGYTARSATKANGSLATGNELPANQAFGVYAYNTGSSTDFDPATAYPVFMGNVAVTYTGGGASNSAKYTYSPERYWPNNKENNRLAFFAYYPHNGAGITPAGFDDFAFTVQALPANQVDFMISNVVPNQIYGATNAGTDVVKLSFFHMLTQVRFLALADVVEGATVKVTSLKVVDVLNSGTLTPDVDDATNSTWAQGTTTATYELTLKNMNLTNEAQAITADNQTLLMVPQTLSGDAKLVIEYTITTTNPARVITQTQDLYLKGALEEWKRNQQIVYTLNIGLHPIEISATVANWDDDAYILIVE